MNESNYLTHYGFYSNSPFFTPSLIGEEMFNTNVRRLQCQCRVTVRAGAL